MRKLLLIISTILSFSFFSYSQKIGIKVDKTLSEKAACLSIEKIFPLDSIKGLSTACLFGSLKYNVDHSLSNYYIIDSIISIDTIFAKKDKLELLSAYEDTSSYIYSTLRIIKKPMENDISDFKNGIISQSDFNTWFKEDSIKYTNELIKIKKEKEDLIESIKSYKDDDVLVYNIKYNITKNGNIKLHPIVSYHRMIDKTYKPTMSLESLESL